MSGATPWSQPHRVPVALTSVQGSSIGNYSSMWVNEFYISARGDSTQSWLETPKTRRAKVPYPAVKILFPTAQYVRESVLGESVRPCAFFAFVFAGANT